MLLAAALLAAAMTNPMIVSTDWLSEHLRDPLVVIVEVGTRSDYDAAHIPGARFIAQDEIVANRDGRLSEVPSLDRLAEAFRRAGVGDTKKIVVYSRKPLMATRTWFTLDYLGHGARASILDGGWQKWTAENRTTTADVVRVAPQPFTIDTRPYALVSIEEMKDLVRHRSRMQQKLVSLDARAPRFYRGDAAGDDVKRAGHLPDAVSIPWTANLVSEDPPVLRDEKTLRQMYEAAGITRDSVVVTYCRTGVEASMSYFVLRLLGYDAALYDGSMTEWSRAADTVVVKEP